jgi:YbbR domain-containing protein
VSRIVRLLFHNWPLKLAAIVLASMLYIGLVIAQSQQECVCTVPIDPVNQSDTAVLSSSLPQVTRIRYVSIGDASGRASADSFRATIDLSGIEGGPVFVPVRVESVDPRFIVLGADPTRVQVRLDPLTSKDVPVKVVTGPTPANLDVRAPVFSPQTVTVTGPASVVNRITSARADVVIEPAGLEVDRDVDLIPVDELGNRVTPAKVEPSTAHVQIAVFSALRTRSLPVNPDVVGSPADGYRVVSVTVSPDVVGVEIDADQLATVTVVDTAPVSISGAIQDIAADVALAPPVGVLPQETTTVHVVVSIVPIAGTRTFDAGIVLTGARADLHYSLSVNDARATAGGPLADLERIDPATFILTAPVAGLGPGTHEVLLEANLPIGLNLVAIDPPRVTVTITVPALSSPAAVP